MAFRNFIIIVTSALLVSIAACGHKNAPSAQADAVFIADCAPPTSIDAIPATLAQTGCFSTVGGPSAKLFNYSVNSPLWANGAGKERYLLLPQGAPASFDANGVLVPPIGTVVFKEFGVGDVRLETRLLWYSAAGTWNGYSYEWNADQNVATLLPDGATATVDGQSWTYPSRSNCLSCHNAVAGSLLGVRVPELDRDNQLQAMAEAKLIVMPNVDANTPWPDPSGDAPLEKRARSYLAANCAYCHRPGGKSGTATDFTYDAPLASMGACGVTPTRGNFGHANAMIIAPGDANNSMISMRMHSAAAGEMMPPIGRTLVDTQGAAVVDAWINSLTSCQ